ncbi:hypothetical protein [Allorhizocola rhizosphaerae]|uniref:hypothetical protein n=1 Tax=Allorhizocola rhizosphaerae TaxID=1872709 RepID=UPI0013C30F93|nr:hypothetical protein [Allorhizocola rhizosphaerae]
MQQPKGGNNHYLGWNYQPIAAVIAKDCAREPDTFAEQTGGQLRPTYVYVSQAAGRLSIGDVVIEPNLGQLRLAAARSIGAFVLLGWSDDYGPCTPSGRYSADQRFAVRVPGPTDRHYIQQKVDAAARHNRVIPPAAARLVAAHLHTGPRSALYRFAINGSLLDNRIVDELNNVLRFRPVFTEWVHALGRYCVERVNRGPIGAWQTAAPDRPPPEPNHGRREAAAPSPGVGSQHQLDRSRLPHVPSETVQELIDAAFAVGYTAARTVKSRKPRYANLSRAVIRQPQRSSFRSPFVDRGPEE